MICIQPSDTFLGGSSGVYAAWCGLCDQLATEDKSRTLSDWKRIASECFRRFAAPAYRPLRDQLFIGKMAEKDYFDWLVHDLPVSARAVQDTFSKAVRTPNNEVIALLNSIIAYPRDDGTIVSGKPCFCLAADHVREERPQLFTNSIECMRLATFGFWSFNQEICRSDERYYEKLGDYIQNIQEQYPDDCVNLCLEPIRQDVHAAQKAGLKALYVRVPTWQNPKVLVNMQSAMEKMGFKFAVTATIS